MRTPLITINLLAQNLGQLIILGNGAEWVYSHKLASLRVGKLNISVHVVMTTYSTKHLHFVK